MLSSIVVLDKSEKSWGTKGGLAKGGFVPSRMKDCGQNREHKYRFFAALVPQALIVMQTTAPPEITCVAANHDQETSHSYDIAMIESA
eukprot:3883329-Amphidinium_carterae.1